MKTRIKKTRARAATEAAPTDDAADEAPPPRPRYADLSSRGTSDEARRFTIRLYTDVTEWQHATKLRTRGRTAKSGVRFVDAIERFVGDLLRARAGESAPGVLYRDIGESAFKDDPVKYDVFHGVLKGLVALDYVKHEKGKRRWRSGPAPGSTMALRSKASHFTPTDKLIALAGEHGIDADNVIQHFKRDLPRDVLRLREPAAGLGGYRERGRIIKDFDRTPEVERMERDVHELNAFLAGFRIEGGEHGGYVRCFNLGGTPEFAWNKGGRLYSMGSPAYQQLPSDQRRQMTINGEPLAEVDIRASHLVIFYARIAKVPLPHADDPYRHAGVDRDIAKLWTVASFGKSRPAIRWPKGMIDEYRVEFGKELSKVASAPAVAEKMLKAFPALSAMAERENLWADLQFIEAEAVIGAMLELMRSFTVPSLSMHDGLLVPEARTDLVKEIVSKHYVRKVGLRPTLTVKPSLAKATWGL